MKKINLFLLLAICVKISIAQDVIWHVELHSFFNNTEFGKSAVKHSQTMTGVSFAPQIGLSYQEKHRMLLGVNAIHEFGSHKAIDYAFPMAYYHFKGNPFTFYMGSFPRKGLIDNYSRMFFKDSVGYYRPVINGLLWEIRSSKDDFFNVWFDWTGRQTYNQRESFFMGWSGKYNHNLVYIQQFGYMFHYAGSLNPTLYEPVQDNGLILTALGLNLSENTFFDELDINAGWSVGLERDRGSSNRWINPNGFLSEIRAEYKYFGVFNTLYKGEKQQKSYKIHENNLYWGDQTYRVNTYNRTDFYVNFIKNKAVNVKFIYSFHFMENRTYHEQTLNAVFGF